MTDTSTPQAEQAPASQRRDWRSLLTSTEIDTRLAGMIAALVVIWVAFDLLSGGDFLTSRNLWNLSVQSASIAVMATGMVLIIVSRNIDLSVGSLLGFLGYVMAMVQTRWIPDTFGFGLERKFTWIVALAVGVLLGGIGLLAAPSIVHAQSANGVALIIGNSKYKWEASLPNAKRDATDIAQQFEALGLKGLVEWSVEVLKNG